MDMRLTLWLQCLLENVSVFEFLCQLNFKKSTGCQKFKSNYSIKTYSMEQHALKM